MVQELAEPELINTSVIGDYGLLSEMVMLEQTGKDFSIAKVELLGFGKSSSCQDSVISTCRLPVFLLTGVCV